MTVPSPEGQRMAPQLPAEAMKTYQILSPRSTHFREATCEEVDCRNHARGWASSIDTSTELGQRQAHYIRNLSGRRFTEQRTPVPGIVRFEFEPGQTCFQRHQARTGRPEIFIVRDGDWRGNPLGTGPRRHTSPEYWVEDFAEHQQKLADLMREG